MIVIDIKEQKVIINWRDIYTSNDFDMNKYELIRNCKIIFESSESEHTEDAS